MMYQKRRRCRTSRYFNRKGQVTLFIIIGILLLLALILVIVLQQQTSRFIPGEIIPTQKGKVERFIDTCISDLGQEAVLRLGIQGGYVQLPDEIRNDGNLQLRLSPALGIPYWAVGEATFIPSLEDIEQRINRHVEENLQRCVFALQAFQETYRLVEKSPVIAHTEITDEQVLFKVTWQVEVQDAAGDAGETIARLEEHQAASSVKLKAAREIASTIIEREMKDLKLEDITQDLLALEHPALPLAGFSVSCEEKSWPIFQVKRTMQDLLRVNIRELQLAGPAVVEYPEELSYYQHHYVWDVGEVSPAEKDLEVRFVYENTYPFTFDVRPRRGSTLHSTTLGGGNPLVSLLCLQNWKFVYDLSYPVVVKIRDPENDYTFQIAIMVHVKRNMPDRGGKLPTLPPTRLPVTTSDEEFCRNLRIPMTLATYTLVDNGQGTYFREPLDNVDLSFTCFRYTCPLGETTYNYGVSGDVAGIRRNLPYCVGGLLRGTKEEYVEATQRLVTLPEGRAELDLRPLKSIPLKNLAFVTHEFTSPQLIGPAQPLNKDAIIILKLKYSDTGDTNSDTNNDIISSTITYGDEQVISPAKIMADENHPLIQGVGLEQELHFLAEADFTPQLEITLLDKETIIGGYQASWKIPWQDLQAAESITFHLLEKADGSEEERFAVVSGLPALSPFIPAPELRQDKNKVR